MSKDPRNTGLKIDHADAKILFDRMTVIRQKFGPAIRNFLKLLPDPDDAQRFYTGRDGSEPMHEDIAFFFNRESILDIIKLIANSDADGLVVIPGARGTEINPIPDDHLNEHAGRPTVMLFPYTYTPGVTPQDDTYSVIHSEGREHPGTGSFPRATTNPQPAPEIPDHMRAGGIHMIPLVPVIK